MSPISKFSYEVKDKVLRNYFLLKKSSQCNHYILNQLTKLYPQSQSKQADFTKLVLFQFSDQNKGFEKFRIEFLIRTRQFYLAKHQIKNAVHLKQPDILSYLNKITLAMMSDIFKK